MQKITAHSKSSLFLMEMILSVLILSLTCTACVRILAAAKKQRQEARELNHIQELVTSAGETLEGWDGQLSSFSAIFGTPGDVSDADTNSSADPSSGETSSTVSNTETSNIFDSSQTYLLTYYYNSEWKICEKSAACYSMTIQLGTSQDKKSADLNFYDQQGKSLYQLSTSFPFDNAGKDGRS